MLKTKLMKLALEEIEQDSIAEQLDQQSKQADQHDECFAAIDSALCDIDSHADYIEGVVGDVDDVQAISTFTENSEEKGIDSVTAAVLELATENLYEKLGVRPSTRQYAAEDFGSNNARTGSTKVAVEGFREFIKNIWEAIKAAFKKMGMYLSHYVKTVFSANTQAIKTASLLEIKMKKNPINASNRAIQKNTSVQVSLPFHFISEVTNGGEDLVFIDRLSEDLQKSALVVVKSVKLINTFSQYLTKTEQLKDLVKTEEALNTLVYPDLQEGFELAQQSWFTGRVEKDALDSNSTYWKSDEMFGSKAICIAEPTNAKGKTGREAVKAIEKTSIKLSHIKRSNTQFHDTKQFASMDAVRPQLYPELLKTVMFTCKKIAESEKSYLDLVSNHDKMIKEIEAVELMLGQSEEVYSSYKDRVATIRSFANSVNRLTSEMIKVISGSLVKSCYASVKLADLSYNAYARYQ